MGVAFSRASREVLEDETRHAMLPCAQAMTLRAIDPWVVLYFLVYLFRARTPVVPLAPTAHILYLCGHVFHFPFLGSTMTRSGDVVGYTGGVHRRGHKRRKIFVARTYCRDTQARKETGRRPVPRPRPALRLFLESSRVMPFAILKGYQARFSNI